jgi:hypothetical protein
MPAPTRSLAPRLAPRAPHLALRRRPRREVFEQLPVAAAVHEYSTYIVVEDGVRLALRAAGRMGVGPVAGGGVERRGPAGRQRFWPEHVPDQLQDLLAGLLGGGQRAPERVGAPLVVGGRGLRGLQQGMPGLRKAHRRAARSTATLGTGRAQRLLNCSAMHHHASQCRQ